MKTIQLNNGQVMPAFGLGTWKSDPGEVGRAVTEAIRVGYRHIDCAWIYGNEAEIGEALQVLFDAGEVTREELWITSKLWNDCHQPEDVEGALRGTLESLRLAYLDLYLVHWPVAHRKGVAVPTSGDEMLSLDKVPYAGTWAAMEDIADAGLARSIGVSNLSVAKLGAVLDGARIRPAVNQIELHPYLQQDDMLAFCAREGVTLTAYSPLGSRDRVAAMRLEDEPVLLEDPVLATVAAKHGVSPAQVLIAWALARGTSVIPKSANPERIRQNLDATEIELDADDMAEIAKLDRHRRYVDGTFWEIEGGPYKVDELWA
ncbi:MAG: aldo/keto reductase [Acidobacteriota bacterium]